MRIASRLAAYVSSRNHWLNVRPFDIELEKEYRQKQLASSISPVILFTFLGGVAFILLFTMQLVGSDYQQTLNIRYSILRIFSGVVLTGAAVSLACIDETNRFVDRIVVGVFIFLAFVISASLLFRLSDQDSTLEIGLASILYMCSFCFRLEHHKFKVFMLIMALGYFIPYFFLRGLLAPVNNYGPAFDLAARIPETFVPQVQVLQAFIFSYVIYLLMESRERRLFLREKKLDLSNQSRLHLLQAIGHDLRQPMTSIMLQQGIAKEAAKLNNQTLLFDSLELIESSMLAISGELRQLTEIAAIQSNEYVPDIKSEAIADLMSDLNLAFAAEAKSNRIAFNLSVQPSLRSARIDTDRQIMGRVLNNLVSNAIKYSSQETGFLSRIDVVVSQSVDSEIEILVRDNGIGISEANIEKIWKPFFQVQNAERNRLKGYGLGLTQVRVALEKLIGHSVHCSSRIGQGSEFRVLVYVATSGIT